MHGRRDFATGLPIPDDEEVQFDHIHAFAEGGETDLNNIAPMSAETNRAKGTLALADFRVKRRLSEFFRRGDRLTLGHLLTYLKENGDVKSYGEVIEAVEISLFVAFWVAQTIERWDNTVGPTATSGPQAT